MANALERLAEAMIGASFLYHPPDWEGNIGLGIPGLSGVPRPVPWEAIASASAPGLPGDELRFAVTADGATPADEKIPEGALAPLVAAVAKELHPRSAPSPSATRAPSGQRPPTGPRSSR